MSTASASGLGTIVERMGLKTLVESCLVLEEGVASAKDIEMGMMMGAGILPGPFSTGRRRRPRHDPGAARESPTGVGRRLRTPLSAQAAGGTEPAGEEDGPGLLPLSAAGPRRAARDRAARDTRRHRHRVAEPPAGEPALAAGSEGPDRPVGVRRGQGAGARDRLLEHLHLQRGGRHQGVHEDVARRRGRRPRRGCPPLHARDGAVLDGDDRRRELDRLRRRLRAGDGVRLPDRGRVGHLRPAGDQPRDHPGLRRHPAAAAARGRAEGARDEPHRRPDRRLRGAPRGARQPGRAGSRAVRHGAGVGAQAVRAGADRGGGDQEALGSAGPRRGTSQRGARGSRVPSGPRTRRRASPPSSRSAGRGSRASEGRIHRRGAGREPAARG